MHQFRQEANLGQGWGFSPNVKGPPVFAPGAPGAVRRELIGSGEARGGTQGIISAKTFQAGTHWFSLSGNLLPLVKLCVCSPGSANRVGRIRRKRSQATTR
jgi:hypothetical protein